MTGSSAPVVYVLDDDAAVRDSVGAVLRTAGFETVGLATPEAFFEAYDPRRPGCLVLDLKLENASGLAVHAELTGRGIRLPVIVVTAYGTIESAVQALKRGAVDYLEKPYAPPALMASVREALGAASEDAAAGRSSAAGTLAARTFRREGEYWTLGFAGRVTRLRDLKGLHYLSYLLHHPGQVVEAVGLAALCWPAPPGAVPPPNRDVGPLLDERAKAEYRARAAALRADLEEAEAMHDLGRADGLRAELEWIGREMETSVGRSGRDRTAGAHAERARVMVTKCIRTAIRRIAEEDPALGRHLRAAVRTGRLCAYAPPPDDDGLWAS